MNTPITLGLSAVALLAAFGAAFGIGVVAGPVGATGTATAHDAPPGEHAVHGDDDTTDDTPATSDIPGGLMISDSGYTLTPTQTSLPVGPQTLFSFQVLGLDGLPVTAYDKSHDKDLHLIAVRRDMVGFQHVHPTLDDSGTWTTPLALVPGQWRVFADFTPSGHAEGLTLGADLAVAGQFAPDPLPAPAPIAEVDDYTVTLTGELVPGSASELTLSVTQDGRPVQDLQPYLAAYGHLVALRDGDLAFLHVHPAGEPGDGVTEPGPDITFFATAPSPGAYRLFLDFQHGDVVRTAEFTAIAGDVAVPADSEPNPADPPPSHDTDAHAH